MKKINIIRTVCTTFLLTSLSYNVAFAENAKGMINVESVPIVDNISVSSEIVDIAVTDNTFDITNVVDGFYEVNYNGKVGFINTEFVNVTTESETIKNTISNDREVLENLFAVPNVSSLNVRSEATTEAAVLGKLSQGMSLEAVATLSSGWVEVLYNGQTGFLSNEFVDIKTEEEIPKMSDVRAEIVSYSKQFLGTPYVYGGTNLTSGVDCSGYVLSIFKNSGITLSRTSKSQINDGVRIDKSELQPGDLVFFSYYGGSGISHSGIYIGENKFIHAASGSANRVIITDLNEDYYVKNYYGAARVL